MHVLLDLRVRVKMSQKPRIWRLQIKLKKQKQNRAWYLENKSISLLGRRSTATGNTIGLKPQTGLKARRRGEPSLRSALDAM